jgi:uncharacterized protein with FMN-binding domain
MSAKTKIVVLHMKELIYTGIFAVLGILFIVLFLVFFLPGRKDSEAADSSAISSEQIYTPGVYTTELVLAGEYVDVEVIVDTADITSVRLTNVNDTVTTMYPLLEPALESICEQLYSGVSPEQVSYTSDTKYTSLVLLEAIKNSLENAKF